jgi:uncharacterized protein
VKRVLRQIGVLIVYTLLFAKASSASVDYEQILSKQKASDVAVLRRSFISQLNKPSELLQLRTRYKDADRSILVELSAKGGYPQIVLLTELDGRYFIYRWLVGIARDNSRDHGKLIRQIQKIDFDKAFEHLNARNQSPPSKKFEADGVTWQLPGYGGIVSLTTKQTQRQYLLSYDDLYELTKSSFLKDLVGYSFLGGGHYHGGYKTIPGWTDLFIENLTRLPRHPKAQIQFGLFEALNNHNWSLVGSLIDQGADVNDYLEDGSTPLIWATLNNRNLIAQQLLKLGADPLRETFFGETPEDLINRFRVREVVSSSAGSVSARREFLSKKAQNALTSIDRCNVLLDILSNENTSDLATLINDELSPNCSRASGATLVMLAAGNAEVKILETVIAKQGDLNATNFYGATALMYAASASKSENVALLVSKNADVAIKDKQGQTALMMANQQNNKEIVALLESALQKGSPPK